MIDLIVLGAQVSRLSINFRNIKWLLTCPMEGTQNPATFVCCELLFSVDLIQLVFRFSS
jgi:hypothetical protein